MLNKNSLRKYTIVRDKQPQNRECDHFEQRASIKKKKKRSSENLTVVGLSNNRAVYIASSKFFEPKRFVWHLNKVGGEYIQEQQPNKSHCYNQNMGFVD